MRYLKLNSLEGYYAVCFSRNIEMLFSSDDYFGMKPTCIIYKALQILNNSLFNQTKSLTFFPLEYFLLPQDLTIQNSLGHFLKYYGD